MPQTHGLLKPSNRLIRDRKIALRDEDAYVTREFRGNMEEARAKLEAYDAEEAAA